MPARARSRQDAEELVGVGVKGPSSGKSVPSPGGASHSMGSADPVQLEPDGSGGGKLSQDSNDMDELYEQAGAVNAELQDSAEAFAAKTGAASFKRCDKLKGQARAKQKVETKYGGNASGLLDLTRASVIYHSLADIEQAAVLAKQTFTVVREKDRFKGTQGAGYRDYQMNVKLSNGHIGELQLHHKDIISAKDNGGHKLYEEMREIAAAAEADGNRALTAEEATRVAQLTSESDKLYGDAFTAVLEKEGRTAEAGE